MCVCVCVCVCVTETDRDQFQHKDLQYSPDILKLTLMIHRRVTGTDNRGFKVLCIKKIIETVEVGERYFSNEQRRELRVSPKNFFI